MIFVCWCKALQCRQQCQKQYETHGHLGEAKNKNLNLKREREILHMRKEPIFVFTSLKAKIMISTAWSYKAWALFRYLHSSKDNLER